MVGRPLPGVCVHRAGSGFIRLPDNTLYEIGYAGHNGQDYTPIGRQMVADGKIERFKLSLDTMIKYSRTTPRSWINIYT